MIRLYKDTMRDDAMELGDHANMSVAKQQELTISECVAAYNVGDKSKIARIEEREDESRKWKAYHRNARKYRESISKATYSKDGYPF